VARLPLHRWRYSTRILFSGCDREVYQQDLVVHRTAGRDYEEDVGGTKTWHIYIGPKCRPDYGDLRFTDGDAREFAYYLWPGFDAASARVCVRLEGADAAGTLAIHYGNPAAATTSDGDATFELFDEFNGLWPTYSGSPYSGYPKVVDGEYAADSAISLRSANHGNLVVKSPDLIDITNKTVVWRQKNTLYVSWTSDPYLAIRLYSATGSMVGSKRYTDPPHRPTTWTTETWTPTRTGDVHVAFWYWDDEWITNIDWILVRAYSATPPSLLRTSRGVSPAYAGLVGALPGDSVIRFAGVGDIRVLGDDRYAVSGAGAFAIETRVSSPITAAGTAEMAAGINLMPSPAVFAGAGGIAPEPARLHTPLDMEAGEGSAYVAPTPVQFDLTRYRFSSLTISRSAQDALWQCEGRIAGLDAPLAYKQFEVRVPDHNGVLRTLFVGFVPGRDYVRAVAADESVIQGYDAGFYLTRQYLPDGDLNYPKEFAWGPMSLLRYWLGEETTTAGSRSRWEQVTGIYPYRLSNPHSYYEWPYDKRIDWNFMPKTTKAQAIQEVCEKSGLVFLVKWRKINGVWRPCAYLVPEEDIDHYSWGLDLPGPVTFTHPDPHVIDGVRVTMRSDEKYNRIVVRSAAPSGAWFEAIRETPGLRYGDELPTEYLEERGDLPDEADHGGWCNARADELYAYYTKYAYTYTLTLINRVDLELYQRCRFYGFDAIPSGEMMRIIAITYNVLPTHTEVEITVTPDSRLSDLRRLQRSQAADSVSEVQTIAQSQIDRLAAGEVGTVIEIDGNEAIVELERKADSSVRGRIV
jgi:hypothetical protein